MNGQTNVGSYKDKNDKFRIGFILLKNKVMDITDVRSTAHQEFSPRLSTDAELTDPVEAIKTYKKKPCKLDIHDAVEFSSNLSADTTQSPAIDERLVERHVSRNVHKVLLAVKKSPQDDYKSADKESGNRKGEDRRRRNRDRPSIKDNKARLCFDFCD